MIKAWIKADSERGLSRAVGYIRSLALNGHNLMHSHDEEENCARTKDRAETNENAPTVFERIASWGASLLSKDDPGEIGAAHEGRQNPLRASLRSNIQSEKNAKQKNNDGRGTSSSPRQIFAGVGMSSRLNYLNIFASDRAEQYTTRDGNRIKPPQEKAVLVDSAVQEGVQVNHKSFTSSQDMNKDVNVPIGPLPNIEENVTPNLRTFQLVVSGKC